jgi:hypothetical protein
VNPLRRLLLGSGRLPAELGAALALEDLVLLAEELSGSITVRGHRTSLRQSLWRREPISGAIAVTARRLVVWAGRSKHIDVPLTHPLRAAIEVAVDRPDCVRFAYDAAAFDASRSGRVELRLRTAQAARVAELLATSS